MANPRKCVQRKALIVKLQIKLKRNKIKKKLKTYNINNFRNNRDKIDKSPDGDTSTKNDNCEI